MSHNNEEPRYTSDEESHHSSATGRRVRRMPISAEKIIFALHTIDHGGDVTVLGVPYVGFFGIDDQAVQGSNILSILGNKAAEEMFALWPRRHPPPRFTSLCDRPELGLQIPSYNPLHYLPPYNVKPRPPWPSARRRQLALDRARAREQQREYDQDVQEREREHRQQDAASGRPTVNQRFPFAQRLSSIPRRPLTRLPPPSPRPTFIEPPTLDEQPSSVLQHVADEERAAREQSADEPQLRSDWRERQIERAIRLQDRLIEEAREQSRQRELRRRERRQRRHERQRQRELQDADDEERADDEQSTHDVEVAAEGRHASDERQRAASMQATADVQQVMSDYDIAKEKYRAYCKQQQQELARELEQLNALREQRTGNRQLAAGDDVTASQQPPPEEPRTAIAAAGATQPEQAQPMHKWRLIGASIVAFLLEVTMFALSIAAYCRYYNTTTYTGSITPTPTYSHDNVELFCRVECEFSSTYWFTDPLNSVTALSSGTTAVDKLVNALYVHAVSYAVSGCEALPNALYALSIIPAPNAAGTPFITSVNCADPSAPLVSYVYRFTFQGGVGFIRLVGGSRIAIAEYVVDRYYEPFAAAILAFAAVAVVVRLASLILVLCRTSTAHALYRHTMWVRGVLLVCGVLNVAMTILASVFLGLRTNMSPTSPTSAVQSIIAHMLGSCVAMHAVILAFSVVDAIIDCAAQCLF